MITFGHVTFKHTCAGSVIWEEMYLKDQVTPVYCATPLWLYLCVYTARQHDSSCCFTFLPQCVYHGWSVPMFVVLSLHSAVMQLEYLLSTPVVRSVIFSCANVSRLGTLLNHPMYISFLSLLFTSWVLFLSSTSFPLLKLPSPFPFLHLPYSFISPSLPLLFLPSHCLPLPCLPLLHALQASAYSYHECSCIWAITWDNCWRSRKTLWCESPWSF